MDRSPFHFLNLPGARLLLLAVALVALMTGCASPKGEGEDEVPELPPGPPTVSATEWSLLEMSFDEAKAISPQNAAVGDLFRVVGDTVEVLKTDDEGKPVKVRAKGHVFLEMALADRATALCHEATVTLTTAVLDGNPMMMQRSRVAKSTSKYTTFRITDQLKVTGTFELIKPEDLMQSILTSPDPLPSPATAQTALTP